MKKRKVDSKKFFISIFIFAVIGLFFAVFFSNDSPLIGAFNLNNLFVTNEETTANELITLEELESRKQELVNIIKTNPSKASSFEPLSEEVINSLSEEQKDEYVEKVGEFTGELSTIHMDDFENLKNSEYIFYLKTNGKTYRMF